MKKIALILLLAIAKIGFAQNNNSQQDTTLVYSSPMYTKDPVRSKWRPTIKRAGEFYQVTFVDKKGVVHEIISFEDRDLTVRKGPYVSYQQGKLKEKGDYDKGHKNGEWITYGSDGDQIKKKETFVYGKLYGKSVEYWDTNQIQKEGNYENGRKIGDWKLYYSDAKIAGKETYDVYGKKNHEEYFSKDGQLVKYDDLFAPPTYKGGIQEFYRFFAHSIQYPKQAAKDRIQGTVKLRFTVKKNGEVEDVEVTESPNEELANEARRVLKMSSNWIPGKMFGETVSVKYNVPIKFSLL